MNNKPLEDNLFLKYLSKTIGNIIKDTTYKQGHEIKQSREYFLHEEYIKEVFLAAAEVQTTLIQLEHTTHFLSNFRSTPKLKKEGIFRFDHIVYHMENFFIRTCSCFDRCLILVNFALNLGNEPEDCSYRLIRKNKHVSKSNIIGSLGEINSLIKQFKEQRNIVIHNKRYYEPRLYNLEACHIVGQNESEIIPDHWIKKEADQFVKEKKEEMNNTNIKLHDAIDRLFNALKLEVDDHYQRLKSKL